MKKLVSTLVISTLLFMMHVPSTLAARNVELPTFLPADTDIYLELNPRETNPFTLFIQNLVGQNRQNGEAFNEPGNIIAERIIQSEQVGFGFQVVTKEYYTDLEGYIFIKATKSEYTKFISALREAEKAINNYFNDPSETTVETTITTAEPDTEAPTEISIGEEITPIEEEKIIEETMIKEPTTEEYKGHVIEIIDYEYMTYYKDKYIVIADGIESLKALIDSNPSTTLAETTSFRDVAVDFQQNSFANIYISGNFYQKFLEEIEPGITENETIKKQLEIIDSAGISLAQKDNYFTVTGKTLLNEETQKELGLYPDKYNFYSRFAKKFSHSEAMLFMEEYNIQQQIADGFTAIISQLESIGDFPGLSNEDLEKMETEIQKNLGVSLNELRDITKEQMGLAIYDNQTIIPGITLAFNVTEHDQEANRLAEFLMYWIHTNAPSEVKTDTVFIGGQKIPTLTFEGPFKSQPITLAAGVAENNLIISTDKNLKDHYGSRGISGNANLSQKINSIAYLNPQNAKNLFKAFLMEEERVEEETASKISDLTLAPFGPMFFTTTAKGSWIRIDGTWEMDVEKFADYSQIPELLFTASYNYNDDDYELPFEENIKISSLCDISALGDLESTAISHLSDLGIIKGDPDNCFHPEREVNRAEFVTLINRGFDLIPTIEPINFSDVPADSWFAEGVKKATSAGIIKGNPDGTFAPGNTITLAEAITILNRLNPNRAVLQESEMPYKDIPSDAWYAPEFKKAYSTGLISDQENIIPGKRITRVEAAILIYKALY